MQDYWDLTNKEKELTTKLAKVKEDLANAQKAIDSNPEYMLAELIHKLTCSSNHTDQCGWYYETWDKPESTRTRYADRAKQVAYIISPHVGHDAQKQCVFMNELLKAARGY